MKKKFILLAGAIFAFSIIVALLDFFFAENSGLAFNVVLLLIFIVFPAALALTMLHGVGSIGTKLFSSKVSAEDKSITLKRLSITIAIAAIVYIAVYVF